MEGDDSGAVSDRKLKILSFLRELKENGPKMNNEEIIIDPDYKLISPEKSKREEHDYNLFIL